MYVYFEVHNERNSCVEWLNFVSRVLYKLTQNKLKVESIEEILGDEFLFNRLRGLWKNDEEFRTAD